MTPEQQIIEQHKRGIRVMQEWAAQDIDAFKEMPQEIKDLKVTAKMGLCGSHTGEMNIMLAGQGIDMAIEAAFNLGKAQPKE